MKVIIVFKHLLASGNDQQLASILLKEMRYLVYIRYLWSWYTGTTISQAHTHMNFKLCNFSSARKKYRDTQDHNFLCTGAAAN
jgi:hypothetical protein